MQGPINYIIVKFQGNKFDGSVVRELAKATEAGTITVLDVALVTRNEYGDVHTFELKDDVMRDLLHVDPESRERVITDQDIS